MRHFKHARKFNDHESSAKIGYNLIHDSFSNAKTLTDLQKAVKNSLQVIKTYKLDEYQVQQLEKHGMNCHRKFQRALTDIGFEVQQNRNLF